MAIIGSHHIALVSPNFERTKQFYTETLGFPIVGQILDSPVVFIDIGGTTIELGPAREGAQSASPSTGLTHLAFEVDDVDATYRDLVAKGVSFHIEPRDAKDMRIAFFRDPDGNNLELFLCNRLRWAKKA
jgi:glyoxylase I family protein